MHSTSLTGPGESTNGSWPAESLDSYQQYSTASVMSDCGSTRKFEVMNSSWPTGFVGQEQSVWFGCIRDVSGILDDVAVVVDEGSTVFNVTQNYEPRNLLLDT